MDEIDVWRSATVQINALGFTAAAFDASHRAKEFRERGDLAGAQAWQAIQSKIEELKRIGYKPDATKH